MEKGRLQGTLRIGEVQTHTALEVRDLLQAESSF